MPAFIDITGHRYGQLTVVRICPTEKGTQWLCKCDCGKEIITRSSTLRYGSTRSCGHSKGRRRPYPAELIERVREIYESGKTLDEVAATVGKGRHVVHRIIVMHGITPHKAVRRDKWGNRKTIEMASVPLRRCWVSMHVRCSNPDHAAYHNYGGRGIKVCDRWKNFELFVRDVGERPSPDYSLDRIDNNGDYEPGNVRWATTPEQNRNRRPRSQWSKVCAGKRSPSPSI